MKAICIDSKHCGGALVEGEVYTVTVKDHMFYRVKDIIYSVDRFIIVDKEENEGYEAHEKPIQRQYLFRELVIAALIVFALFYLSTL